MCIRDRKYGRSLQELAIELDRQAKVKKDYVATAGAMQMTAVNENFDLVIGNTPFQLNENAHRQLGLQLKIPAPYYERMRAENPGLLMANVNGCRPERCPPALLRSGCAH